MATWLLLLRAHDERLLHALILRRGRLTDRLMRGVSHLGDAVTTIGTVAILCLGVVPKLQASGAFAAITLVSSHLGVQLLKRTIDRPRPRMPVGYASLVHAPDRFSFPSGHAAASLSVAIGIAIALPMPAGGAIIALATLVGVSRCYLGMHYPGDVLAGWLLAISGAWLAALAL
ncbi:MAG: phosphatase PAP2 family protein [Gemmatimonadota bacterium]